MKIIKTPFSWGLTLRLFGRYDVILAFINNEYMVDTADGGPVDRENYSVEE